ncbi:grasp-with-spasm system SPASM domain peptide maturase [Aquimarina gracilis]|uniref:Grasp-with-spasm system SPASM domain peptide maturase n=1 Tax=Aquimarina gracilis TaxID=874422 RepID=A0ABU5ZQ79_9FLAO|nr:grasp-with-spasm system SPASM domain peptide maturase [Aquimarina gracilis]MEB3344235.1 grasp-with-spasm system SPASM domain peptide maturase [Aquimarina gracilis]
MMNQDLPFKLIANCIPVKGAKRSTICDLTRNDIKLIPNDLYNILIEHEGKSIQEIKEIYNNKYNEIINEYFDFLLKEEFIIFTDTPELFPKISLQWFEPKQITHAILDVGKNTNYDLYKAIKDLDDVGCKHLEVRFFKKVDFDGLKNIVEFIDSLESPIVSIDFTLPFHPNFEKEKILDFLSEHGRVCSLRIHGSPIKEFIPPIDKKSGYVIYSDQFIKNEKFCGVIDPSLFSINIKSFTESQHYNSCLNRKTSVDVNGDIKNCPSMTQSFGNIQEISIKKAIKNKDYKKYWSINKDQIDTCKDCEFRHICTDCRAFIDNPDDIYTKPLKCGYDPYTNQWEKWYNNPLKEKTIVIYKLEEIFV